MLPACETWGKRIRLEENPGAHPCSAERKASLAIALLDFGEQGGGSSVLVKEGWKREVSALSAAAPRGCCATRGCMVLGSTRAVGMQGQAVLCHADSHQLMLRLKQIP